MMGKISNKKESRYAIKLVLLSLSLLLACIALLFIIRYSQSTSQINITRLPYQNSRVAGISRGYASQTDLELLSRQSLATQELFSLEVGERRDFIARQLELESSPLSKPVIGDYLIWRRIQEVQTDIAANGLEQGQSVASQLSYAVGIAPADFDRLLRVALSTQSIHDYWKSYPNLASMEWEIFIQSQELNQLLQGFSG
jgi:hypothetical protein